MPYRIIISNRAFGLVKDRITRNCLPTENICMTTQLETVEEHYTRKKSSTATGDKDL